MDLRQRTRRFGVYVIACAVLLRLTAEGVFHRGICFLLQRDSVPIHTYSETGQVVRFSASSEKIWDHVRESPPPWQPEPELEQPCFSPEEAAQVALYNTSSRKPDVEALLQQPLHWDLTGGTPSVLILHTHGTESYTPGEEPYAAVSGYRTLEETQNMLSIGAAVAESLEQQGIGVIHDREIYDYPAYNGAYSRTRKAITEHLEANPGIQLVLDLHRDAGGTGAKQLRTEATVAGQTSAQLMLVQGTNFDTWEENFSLAVKLHALLERQHPGIMRPLSLRGQRFNQDLSPGALLVEVGAAGNTRQEALLAASALAEAVALLARGTAPGTEAGQP